MSDKSANEEVMSLDPDNFVVGYDDEKDPKVMVFTVPLAKMSMDMENGKALVIGKFEQTKQLALGMMAQRRKAELAKQPGLIMPGAPKGKAKLEMH